MTSKFICNPAGLTLLETIIALLIFSVAVLGVAAMQISSMHSNGMARRATCDSVSASEFLETILSLPYDDPLLSDPDNGYVPSNPDHGPFKVAATPSTIEWEVDDEFPAANTKRVRITVRMPGNGDTVRAFTWDYIKAKDFV